MAFCEENILTKDLKWNIWVVARNEKTFNRLLYSYAWVFNKFFSYMCKYAIMRKFSF